MKKKNRIRKFIAVVVILTILCSNMTVFSEAATVGENMSQAQYEANVLKSNDMVFSFWDYYTDNENEEYCPPDYFGGFNLNDDGSLTVYLTEDTRAVKDEMIHVCESNDIYFAKVEYSFNELKGTLDYINSNLAMEEVVSLALDLSANKVVIYAKPPISIEKDLSMLVTTKNILGKMEATLDTDIIDVRAYEYNNQQVISSVSGTVENERVGSDMRTMDIDALEYYVFYPGQETAFGESQCGTIGFCAVDEEGTRLLITHGHGYEFSGPFDPDSVTVGGFTMEIYNASLNVTSGEDQMCDAAYIIVPDSVPRRLSNKVVNSAGTRIIAAVTEAQLASYNNPNVRAYGDVSGFITTTATIEFVDQKPWLTMNNVTTAMGDSGGPIYLIGSSGNRLLGIMSYQYGGGTVWTVIQERYEEINGISFEPYVLDTYL